MPVEPPHPGLAWIVQLPGGAEWHHRRPRLGELTPAQNKSPVAELEARGFDMPGLAGARTTATA